MKAGFFCAVTVALSLGATAQGLASTPAYSAKLNMSVESRLNCYLRPQLLLTSTPYGDGFLIRRKNENAAIVLVRDGDHSRAELYRASDSEGRALLHALRSCELHMPFRRPNRR